MICKWWIIIIYISWVNISLAETLSLTSAIKIALENNRHLHYKAQYDIEIAKANYQMTLSSYRLKGDFESSASESKSKSYITTVDKSIKRSEEIKYPSNIKFNWQFPLFLGSKLNLFANADLTKTDSKTIEKTTRTHDKKYTSSPNIGFDWSQPLSLSGVRSGHADLIQAEANYKLACLSYQQIKEDLLFNVIDAYYRLISAKNAVKLAEEELKITQELLRITKTRFEQDQIAKLDLMQVKVQLAENEARLIANKNSAKNLWLTFCRFLNIPTESKMTIPEEPLIEDIDIFSLLITLSKQKAISISLKDRIDVKQQQINLELAKLNLNTKQSINKPTLSLQGKHYWKGDKKELSELKKDIDTQWEVSARVSIPIIDGGMSREEVKSANLSLEKAKYEYDELIKDIHDEIDQLYENIQAEKGRLNILQMNLELAQESLKIIKLKYQEGLETANEVLRSQITLFQMKNSINEARIALLINKAKLLKAIGKLEARL